MIPTRSVRNFRASSLGFIGLGAMGRNMASKLVCKAFAQQPAGAPKPTFVVYDAYKPSVDAFLAENTKSDAEPTVIIASTPSGVSKLAGTVFTMLPSSPQVEEVYLGKGGLFEGIAGLEPAWRAQSLFVDCTSLDQAVAKDVARQMGEMGASMIDAPVSGGTVGAKLGKLSFMVGGPEEAFQRAKKYLGLMGSRAIYCGDAGNSLAAKICNNLLLGTSMAGTAEAMLLGASLGIAPELLASILNTSTGRCWSSELNNPAPGATPTLSPPADRTYSGGFVTKLMAKDLNLAMSASRATGAPLPIGSATSALYNVLSITEDFGDRDFSVVFKHLQNVREGK